MKFARKRKLHAGRLDIAPLVDVVLLLIIFFMLTSSFIAPLGMDINLPRASQVRPQDRENLVVAISEDGIIHIDDRPVPPGDIKEVLAGRRTRSPGQILVIKADRGARHGSVVNVMSAAREIGWEKMAIAAESRPGEQEER